MRQPLEQFSVIVLSEFFGVSFSNITIIFLFILIVFFILFFAIYKSFLFGTNLDFLIEDAFYMVHGWFFSQLKSLHSRRYFPLIFLVFLIILVANFLGLVPFSFTLTSQLYFTFLLAFSLFLGIIIRGIVIYKINFIKLFIPSGVSNIGLLLFITLIESVSYLIRPFSLSIRLFANMLAGHTLLYILGNFGFNLAYKYIIGIVFLPFVIIFSIFLLEIGIAFIQAYVFTILLIIYLNDIYNLGH
jgi:F-type H+-transporting ATPase subunit a